MFNKIKDALTALMSGEDADPSASLLMDKKLCAAVLMVHAIAADGKVTPEEEAKFLAVLHTHYEMDDVQAGELAANAKRVQAESVDLYSFTSVVKSQMSETERMGLIEDLWEMVYADGQLHEFEDNLVWRIAELIGINSQRRIALKQVVRDRALDGSGG